MHIVSVQKMIGNGTLSCYTTLLLLLMLQSTSFVLMTVAVENIFTVEGLCEIPDTSGLSLGPLKYPGFKPEVKSTCCVHCISDPECKAFLYRGK